MPERDEDGVRAVWNRGTDRCGVGGVALYHGEVGVREGEGLWRADKRGDSVPCGEGLLNEGAAGASGGAENGDVHGGGGV